MPGGIARRPCAPIAASIASWAMSRETHPSGRGGSALGGPEKLAVPHAAARKSADLPRAMASRGRTATARVSSDWDVGAGVVGNGCKRMDDGGRQQERSAGSPAPSANEPYAGAEAYARSPSVSSGPARQAFGLGGRA